MEKMLYEAVKAPRGSADDEKGIKLKLRLLDGHFYDDVYFKGYLGELIDVIENGQMLYMEKISGDRIFVNSKLVVDFVLS